MVELARAPIADVIEVPAATGLGDNAATRASIARYLAAGERMRVIADVGLKASVALGVLIIAAWALGLLPGAVRPF
jgi:hypothetical protein